MTTRFNISLEFIKLQSESWNLEKDKLKKLNTSMMFKYEIFS